MPCSPAGGSRIGRVSRESLGQKGRRTVVRDELGVALAREHLRRRVDAPVSEAPSCPKADKGVRNVPRRASSRTCRASLSPDTCPRAPPATRQRAPPTCRGCRGRTSARRRAARARLSGGRRGRRPVREGACGGAGSSRGGCVPPAGARRSAPVRVSGEDRHARD